MDEARLLKKLKLIEALLSRATTDGEKTAAKRARKRILERLNRKEDTAIECSVPNMWSDEFFVVLPRRGEAYARTSANSTESHNTHSLDIRA